VFVNLEGGAMSDALDQLRAERLLRDRRARRRAAVGVMTFVIAVIGGLLLFHGATGSRAGVASAAPNLPAATPPPAPTHPARDASTQHTLQDATGLAASLLASTRSTEVARSALVAAQGMTGCAPKEGGPSLVNVGNDAEKAAELASRADFYATAKENGREYATHAQVYVDRRTVVHVAVAWECSPSDPVVRYTLTPPGTRASRRAVGTPPAL
jgi:hypothetical protein